MKSSYWCSLFVCLFGIFPSIARAENPEMDPGKTTLGKITTSVFYATDGNPKAAGEKFKPVSAALRQQLRDEERLRFKSYLMLGQDREELFRSYENWTQPLKPSDEVLVKFEAKSRPQGGMVKLDLELWLSRKKILKTEAKVSSGKPVLVLGPEWRGGRLIISIAFETINDSAHKK